MRARWASGLVAVVVLGLMPSTSTQAQEPTVAPKALSWSSCTYAPGAQCASLRVPRDWARPTSSGTYQISIARVPARTPAARIGVLMFNPGGPGSGARSNLSWVLSLLPSVVRDRFDIVAVDPRGVGGSQPWIRSCKAPQPTPPATGDVEWAAWSRTFVRANATANRACLEVNRDHAGNVGTWQIVRDLDAVRSELGERRINIWGMSYGTAVGRAYAQAFPGRVRALLLDGTISPISSIRSWAFEHTYDDDLAIDTMLGSLGSSYVRTHERVMEALDDRTVRTTSGTEITRWRVGRALVAWSSFHTTWGSAAALLTAMDEALYGTSPARRASAAARAAGILGSTSATGQSGTLSPQWTYVNCADFPDRPGAAVLAEMAETGAREGGVGVGMAVLREGAQCAGLPAIGRPLESMTTPLALPTPPIIANARGDNRTPWTAALEMQRAFAGSRIVGYAGTHHILYGRRTSCVNEPITAYLVQRRLPTADIMCPI